jgi:hypothetical protein
MKVSTTHKMKKAALRSALIELGLYNRFKQKDHGDKSKYTRKTKHKLKHD